MEEKKGTKCCWGFLAFVLGFLLSVVAGWVLFPSMLYSELDQPIPFSHKIHVEDQGLTCDSCHFFREDGSYQGLPTNEQCSGCHSEVVGQTQAEAKYVQEYVQKNKEVPWLNYQYQPDNVLFSHKAHEPFECTECHPDVAKADKAPKYYENKLSGYSKQTMKMWQCERCHAENGVSNACHVCHK